MRCCICGNDMTGRPAMQDRMTGAAYCPKHSEFFHTLKDPNNFSSCHKCGFNYSKPYSQFAQGNTPKCPNCGITLKLTEITENGKKTPAASKTNSQPPSRKWWQFFIRKPQVVNLRSRISKLKTIGEWGGLLASKLGDNVIYLYGGKEIPAGEWLYFLYHLETQPDNRIIFSDTACFWLKVSNSFELSGSGNMYHPIPKEIERCFIQDESYAEWKKAFQAIDDYFYKDDGWKYQWSWKTNRVKQFMAGECSDWVSES